MIKAIEILINNGPTSIFNCVVSYTHKICIINEKRYEVDDEFLDKIKNTILYWKNEYGSSNVIDDEEFTVKVYTNDSFDTYHGKGIYPSNYKFLKEVLGDLNG